MLYIILSSIFSAIMSILIKTKIDDGSIYFQLFTRSLYITIFLLIIIIVNKDIKDFKFNKSYILISIVTLLTWIFYYKATKKLDILKVVTFEKLNIVFTLILSVIFLSEKITFNKIIGIILIILGSLILHFK